MQNDHVEFGRHLSKKEMVGVLRLSMKYRAGLLSKKAMASILRLAEEYRAGLYPLKINHDSTEQALPLPQFSSKLNEDVWALSMVCRVWCQSRFTPCTEGRLVVSQG
jgi:hypothetical protein